MKDITSLVNSIEGIEKCKDGVLLYRVIWKTRNRKLILPSVWISKCDDKFPYFTRVLKSYGPRDFRAEVMGKFANSDFDLRTSEGLKMFGEYVIDELAFFNLNPDYRSKGKDRTGYTQEFCDAIKNFRSNGRHLTKLASEKAGISVSEVSLICNNAKEGCSTKLLSGSGSIYMKKGERGVDYKDDICTSKDDNKLKQVNKVEHIAESNPVSKCNDKYLGCKLYKEKEGQIEEYTVIEVQKIKLYKLNSRLSDSKLYSNYGCNVLTEENLDKLISDGVLYMNKDDVLREQEFKKEYQYLQNKYPDLMKRVERRERRCQIINYPK